VACSGDWPLAGHCRRCSSIQDLSVWDACWEKVKMAQIFSLYFLIPLSDIPPVLQILHHHHHHHNHNHHHLSATDAF
jgi:hypothetical protein